MLKIEVDLYIEDLENSKVEYLLADAYNVASYRGLKLPKPNIKLMKTAEFTTHLNEALNEAHNRGIPLPTVVMPTPSNYCVPQLSMTEEALIESGRFIAALKEYRVRTGAGLKEAKEACDAYKAAWTAAGSPLGGILTPWARTVAVEPR